MFTDVSSGYEVTGISRKNIQDDDITTRRCTDWNTAKMSCEGTADAGSCWCTEVLTIKSQAFGRHPQQTARQRVAPETRRNSRKMLMQHFIMSNVLSRRCYIMSQGQIWTWLMDRFPITSRKNNNNKYNKSETLNINNPGKKKTHRHQHTFWWQICIKKERKEEKCAQQLRKRGVALVVLLPSELTGLTFWSIISCNM
jgi:hypothetical protein